MKKSKYTEMQIVKASKENESGGVELGVTRRIRQILSMIDSSVRMPGVAMFL